MKTVYWAALAAVGAALAYAAVKKAGGLSGIGQSAGGAVVDVATGAVEGVVYGVGDWAGVPRTNLTECERAKLNGDTWAASFACPAADFIKYVFN